MSISGFYPVIALNIIIELTRVSSDMQIGMLYLFMWVVPAQMARFFPLGRL